MKLTCLRIAFLALVSFSMTEISAQTSWGTGGNSATTTSNYLGTSDAKDLFIKTNNQIGIKINGTNLPGQVSIGGTTLANTKLALWDDGSAPYGFGVQGYQFRFHLGINTARFSFLNSASGAEIFTIKGDGAVGIGIANPIAGLQMVNNTSPNLRIGSNTSTLEFATPTGPGQFCQYANASSAVMRIMSSNAPAKKLILSTATYTNGGASIILGSDQSPILIAKDNNTVGIGTDCIPTDGTLAVNGKIYATALQLKLTVNGCFPDYVFEPSYKLMSLKDMGIFIQKNKHLPGIPTAAEVEANGVDVMDLNVKMLEKIEELTLHLIQMEEKIKSLESQLQK